MAFKKKKDPFFANRYALCAARYALPSAQNEAHREKRHFRMEIRRRT